MKAILGLVGMSLMTVLGILSAHSQPAVVGPEGYTNSFSALPPVTEWSTYAYPGAPANVYDLTNLVQSLAASSISSNLVDGSPADPATQRLLAFWTSGGGGYVCTRPTGDRCTLLMVTLLNQTGTNATSARVSYDLAIKAAQVESDYPGLRAFYSLSGASNSWVAIPELSSPTPVAGRVVAELSLGTPWIHGNALYVVWVDDNANIAQAEPGYALDNVFVGVTGGVPIPTSLACTVDAPGNNVALVSGAAVVTAATVFQGSPPYTVEYFTNSGAGNVVFGSAGSSTTAPYHVSLGTLGAGTYNLYAVVTDSSAPAGSATSLTNTFYVADPLTVTLTAPVNGASYDYLTSVEGAATVNGGSGPYAVQFYLDNVAAGAAVTAEPYTHSFGILAAGTHTIKAGVRDSRGWVGSSLVATVGVTGPLGVTLTPSNGTVYNYGQSVVLTGAVIYGTGPYAVSFYTNDQVVGTVSNAPFLMNLGLLAVGSYTGRVHVVDSSSPTVQQVDSSTNVITILENPLVVSLAGLTNGQKVSQGSEVVATATVGAPVTITRVEFFLDGASLGVDSATPYSAGLGNARLGNHGLWAVATDSLGRSATSATVQVTVVIPTGALVGPSGYTNSFATQPLAAEWATWSRAGGGADNYTMDSEVNATITASGVTNRTVADAGNPPAKNANAMWSSTGYYLVTRPTGNRYTVLLGKFTNDSGTNATEIGISYLLTIAGGGVAEDSGMGTRVYYSLSGLTNSWANLPALNNMSSTDGSVTLATNLALDWTNGGSLFLLWVDDNANALGDDAANEISRFSLRVTAGLPPMFTCLVQAPTNGAVFVSGMALTAAARVVYGVEPYTVEYFTNSGAGNGVFASAGSGGTAPYAVNLGSFTAGTYNLYAVAGDSSSTPAVTNSMTNTFFVADPIYVALVAPANDATFDYLASVEGTALVAGGLSPYSVQFYLDGVVHGTPVTAAPYPHNFGPLFVGDHTIQATVTDATGWLSNSPVHAVHITGPLAVMLMPTNGSAFNYGQPMVLTALAGGGTGPYAVTFYVNDQAVGSLSAPSFTVNLGVVPVGSYRCSVHATDSSAPAQQADSGTNLLTIVENPLVATLTSPTNGQSAATNVGFTLAASVAVAAPVTVSRVEFFLDDVSAGVDDTPPYSIRVTTLTLGAHLVHAVATDSLGRQSATGTNSVTAVYDPLANDNFVNRIVLTGPQITVTGSNVGAGVEAGEPQGTFPFTSFGATLWWSWTAPVNGTVVIDTTGSGFNTSLGVYTGTAVNGLSPVAFSGSIFGQSLTQVSFTAQQGTQYQIQLGGMMQFGPGGGRPATGTYQLNLLMPPTVTITSPTNGSLFMAGTSYTITANASSPHGPVTRVDFYLGNTLLGSDTTEPYSLTVTNPPAGTNSLTAVVYDSLGLYAQSTTVNVLVLNVGVTLISPVDGSYFFYKTPISVSALTMLPVGSITNVEFFVNGQELGEDSSAPFSVVWSNVVSGSHRLTAVGYSDAGDAYSSQPVNISIASSLVASNSVWKYLDNGSDQGTRWIAPDFDDSGWASGPAPLGYGDSNGRLVLTTNGFGPDPNNKFVTTYYRQTVVITNIASYPYFVMFLQRDDGAIVYLNGAEVGRFNMPSGVVTYTNWASSNASDDGGATFGSLVDASLFREGTNVFAVEIHQDAGNSSDIWFVMEMLGVPPIVRNAYPTVTLTSPADGTVALAPASFTLSAEASDSDGRVTKVEFFAHDTKLGEATNAPYALPLNDVPAGVYVLTAVATDDQGATQTSAPTTVTVYNPSSRWVAYNDQVAGPGTHPNATAWNAFGTDGGAPGDEGPLRNLVTGASLTANLTVLEFGAFADTACGAPLAGTPAYDTFQGYVDFGTGDNNHAILVNGESLVMHLFTGLDPLRRYNFRGTVVGGVANYSNRWTLFTIVGANSFTAAHTAHVLTSATQPALAADEAAMNTGDNRSGDMVGWDEIAPGPDGSFLILSSQYLGAAPGNAHPGPVAYAPVAVRLEEIGAVPFVQITSPVDGYVVEGPTNVAMSAFASAVGGVSQVQFLGDGAVLGSDSAPPFGIVWNDVPFGTHTLNAVACDGQGLCGTSAPVTITVTIPPTNTIPPMILTVIPTAGATITNLTTIQVVFTERVVEVDASDLLVNGAPASNVAGSGSNYTFSVVQPPYGTVDIRWAQDTGITDVGWPVRLPFDSAEAEWNYNLIDRTPPALVSKTPAAGVTVTNLTQITVTFSEPVAAVDASDLLVNGTPAYDVDGAGATYSFSVSQPASGTVNVSWATNHGIIDLAPAQNAFNATGPGATWSFTLDAKTILIQSNSFWLFVKGTNEASTPTTAWRQSGFDDSGWSNAPAPFFYGDPYSNGVPAYTLLSDMRSNYSTIYLRKTFVVGNTANLTNLFLRAQIDDGMIVWINGVEVLRTNAPAGEVPYSGTALTAAQEPSQTGAAYLNYALPDPRGYLVPGTNVIAVHALNDSLTTSSDFGFNAQLYTYQADTEAVAPRVVGVDPAAGYLFYLTNVIVVFSEPVTNVDAADLLINGVPAAAVSSSTNTMFAFSFPQPPFGAVSVTWATNHGIVDLDVEPKPFNATLPSSTWGYVLLNPNSPHLTAVTPARQSTVSALTEIALTFSEPVTGVDASDLLVNGVPASAVTGSGVDYTFTFVQPAYGIVSITWAANHGIQDLGTPPDAFDISWPSHTWSYTLVDRTPPSVAAVDPAAGTVVVNLTQLTVTFSESVSGVNASDLLLNGKPATGMTGSNANYTFTFPQPNAALINVTWATAHGIRDTATNAFDATAPGASWSYSTVDNVPPTLTSVLPTAFNTVRSLQQITLTFDEPVQGVAPGSLSINGAAAQQLSGAGSGPYTFSFVQPATGSVQIALNSTITDLAVPANPFRGSNWTYVLDPNLAPPTLTRGPYLQMGTPTSMMIRWRTQAASDSSVAYGLDAASLTNSVNDGASATEHKITLTDLRPETRYYYAVGTTDGGMVTNSQFSFVTGPQPFAAKRGSSLPMRIWVLGDGRMNSSAQPLQRNADAVRVAQSYLDYTGTRSTAFAVHTGDIGGLNGTDNELQVGYFDTYTEFLRQSVIWVCIGNHELGASGGTPYLNDFSLPAAGEAGGVPSGTNRYYSFTHGNVHVVSLDSNADTGTNGAQYAWLQRDLAANTSDWLIAFWHAPPYSITGTHNSDNESGMVQMRQNFVPLLEAYGLDLGVFGHNHLYSRTYLIDGHYGSSSTFASDMLRDGGDGRTDGSGAYHKPTLGLAPHEGAVYAVVGNAGASLYAASPMPAQFYAESAFGSMVLELNGNRLDATYLRADGATNDHFTIMKGPLAPVARLTIRPADRAVVVSWPVNTEGYELQFSPALGAGADWQTATGDIITLGDMKVFVFEPGVDMPAGYFRLQKP